MSNRRRQNHGKIRAHGTVFSGNMSQRSRTAVEIAQDEKAVENEHYPGITPMPSSSPNICPALRPPGVKLSGRISTATMPMTTCSFLPPEQYATRRRQNEERRYTHIKKKKGKPQIKASAHRREPHSAHRAERSPGTSASTWHKNRTANVFPEAAGQGPAGSSRPQHLHLSDKILRVRGKRQQQGARAARMTNWL